MGSHVALEVQRDMAGAQYDVTRSFCSLLGCFGPFELEPRRVGGSTRHGGVPMRRGELVLPSFWVFWSLWGRATSCWKPNTTWRGHNATWRALLDPFWAVLPPLGWSHVVLEAQYDVARSNTILHRIFLGLLTQKRHLRTRSEVAGLMLICFLVCLTCQLGH